MWLKVNMNSYEFFTSCLLFFLVYSSNLYKKQVYTQGKILLKLHKETKQNTAETG